MQVWILSSLRALGTDRFFVEQVRFLGAVLLARLEPGLPEQLEERRWVLDCLGALARYADDPVASFLLRRLRNTVCFQA